jgi:PTH1 family peptidyl-tRNA hydrolase
MKLIVGLGNPGKEYEKTRHNVGYMVLNELEKRGITKSDGLVLYTPGGYMNTVGPEIAQRATKEGIASEDVWIITDDFTLDLGTIRVRVGGSSGGHHGLESVIGALKSDEFVRFRVGIGCNVPQSAKDYVLSKFKKSEIKEVDQMIDRTAELVLECLKNGVEPKTLNPDEY